MRILIKHDGGRYTASRPTLFGAQIVGFGRTWREALGDLVLNDPKAFNIDLSDEGVGVFVYKKDGKPYKHKCDR